MDKLFGYKRVYKRNILKGYSLILLVESRNIRCGRGRYCGKRNFRLWDLQHSIFIKADKRTRVLPGHCGVIVRNYYYCRALYGNDIYYIGMVTLRTILYNISTS